MSFTGAAPVLVPMDLTTKNARWPKLEGTELYDKAFSVLGHKPGPQDRPWWANQGLRLHPSICRTEAGNDRTRN